MIVYTTEKIGYTFKNRVYNFGDGLTLQGIKKGYTGLTQKEVQAEKNRLKRIEDYYDIKLQLDINHGAV